MTLLRYALLITLLTGCALTRPQSGRSPTPPEAPQLTPLIDPDSASPTPLSHLASTASTTPSPECLTHDAAMEIEISDTEIRVGELVTITGVLINQGCAMLGLPQYSLFQVTPKATLFEPAEVPPVLHSLGLSEGQQDAAQFILTARHPGEAQLLLSASVEVHLGYPGPAYWATVSSPAVEVTVSP